MMETLRKENANETNINIGMNERWLHLAGGAALLALGAVRGGLWRWAFTAIGGTLLYQGVTGHSPMYQMMGMNTALKTGTRNAAVPQEQGIHVMRAIAINKPVEELYAYWRNFENLPRIMHHVESVRVLDDKGQALAPQAQVTAAKEQSQAEAAGEQCRTQADLQRGQQ